MKVTVTQLVLDREFGHDEVKTYVEKRREIYVKDVACLYRDRYGVYIYLKSGSRIVVDHKLEEIEGYFTTNMEVNEIK